MHLLRRMRSNFKQRHPNVSSLDNSVNSHKSWRTHGLMSAASKSHMFTIERVAEVFMKHPQERSETELRDVLAYMVKNVAFFRPTREKNQMKRKEKKSTPILTEDDKLKMFQVMLYKVNNQGDNLCVY